VVTLGTPHEAGQAQGLRAYLDAALDCVIMADASGCVVEFNPAAERTFGYTRDEALGRTLTDLIVPPSLRELHSNAFARFVERREKRLFGRRLELTGMRSDGSEFPVELALSCVESEPLLVCGAVRDLTDVKRTEGDLRLLADEQAALRRVATLAARESSSPVEVLEAVVEEAARVLEVDSIGMIRFEPDKTATLVAQSETPWEPPPLGTRFTLEGENLITSIHRTGQVARMDDWENASGSVAELANVLGVRSAVASPIVVEGRLWGTMVAATNQRDPLPADTESRIAEFTELLATAISNAESREALMRLADEQAALRRVATLVAAGIQPDELFSAVSDEVAQLFTADGAGVGRFEPDGSGVVSVGMSESLRSIPVGSRQDLDKSITAGEVYRTGRAARFDVTRDDVDAGALGEMARQVLALRFVSTVAAPIVVEGELWGLVTASSSHGTLPLGTEKRVESFCELVATAIANAESRAELAASEAHARELAVRIVAAGDEARRRIERNLHDGTQQRLVALGLDVEMLRDSIPADQEDAQSGLERIRHELETVLEDVRELSHGLHPALLARAGLGPSLRAFARRSPIPVKLDVSVGERPSESTETAVYYVISEALANAAKHADASEISVVLKTSGNEIRAIVEDDGSGGAEVSAGSGLVGLIDRIEALGGRFALHSPPDHGTRISIEMPLTAEPSGDVARVPGGRRSTPDDCPPALPELPEAIDAATLHAAVDASADAFYVVDPRGCIRFLNGAALRILGYEDERQLLGRPSHDTIHYRRPDGTPYPAAECPLLRPRLNGEVVRVDDDWFVRQDGSLVAVAYSSAPVALADGRGAVVSFRDVPEHGPGAEGAGPA
jgi:PAS domain S-box-containing protein